MHLRGLLVIALFSLVFSPLQGQTKKLIFKHVNLEHGLPSGRINTIAQTRDGIMWFGTREGIVKYDNGALTVLKPSGTNAAGSSANDIRAIVEDRSGIVWVGTFGGGLYRYDRVSGKLKQFKSEAGNANSLSDDRVLSVLEDRNGILWIGTVNGLNTFDRTNFVFSVLRHEPDNPVSLSESRVWPLVEDREGNLWVGTLGGGINRLEKSTGAIRVYKNENQAMNSLARNNVMTLLTDKAGRLWVGMEDGGLDMFLHGKDEYDRQQEEFKHFLQGLSVTSIAEDSAGSIIAGTAGSGIKVLNTSTWTVTTTFAHDAQDAKSLAENNIRCLFVDAEKTLWVGTENSGVCVLLQEETKQKKPRRVY